jgi:methyl coenzyme M reductase gamma subunit
VIYRIQDDQQCLQIVTIVHGAREVAGFDPPPWSEPPSTPR